MSEEVGKRSAKPNRDQPENEEQVIRTRAYELYEQRGREDGHDKDDWLRAEEELKKQRAA